ncbi:MAG: PAS domain S-box protein, partial [Phycisphaerales bacterium]|nr:PAS domain S-box protein [Phycisphaerales bacterium]
STSAADTLLTSVGALIVAVDRDLNTDPRFDRISSAGARRVLDCLPDDARDALRSAVVSAIDADESQEVRFVTGEAWYVASIHAIGQTGSAPRCAAILLRDVTAEKESSRQLARLARRNEAILRSAMDGFFVVGEDLRFIEVNDAFCRMVGFSGSELLEMKSSDLEVRGGPALGLSGTHARTGVHHLSTNYRHKNGHMIQLEISVTVLRIDGQKIVVGFARDVTERIRAEQALLESENRFQSLVTRMPLGYIVWTPDMRARDWNPAAAQIFGYSAEQALGKSATELIVALEERQTVEQAWRALLAGESTNGLMMNNIRKDGEPVHCEWFNTVLRDSSNRVECVASLVRDVSERDNLERRLRDSQKLESLNVLAGGVAHDFNNFLLTILCNASLAMEHVPNENEARPFIQKILNASRRASDLTRQMLTYSGRAACEIQPVEFNALIRETTDFLQAALPKNVTVATDLQEGLPAIHADAAQLQQVLMNLVLNASEAIGNKSGVVTISTSLTALDERQISAEFTGQPLTPGRFVRLRVRDTGCGMSPETLARIFEPFFTTKFTGRGLGLATMLGTVRAHRGGVKVRSNVGQGTEFTLLFPAGALHRRTALPMPSVARLPDNARILVVDDEQDIRDVVRAVLESRGATVLTAEDGLRGVAIFRENSPRIDLVLLDMTMPGMSGEEVLREIRSINPTARVLLSSGYSESEATSRFSSHRANGFVQKPYTANELVQKLSDALRSAPPSSATVMVSKN